jgi:3'-phosphoadenosine 5'-phosphosulfate sulfotransferase (PAPS reductase)/FAD synthetase
LGVIVTELWQLKQRQSLPLEAKINHSLRVIRDWYEHWDGQVYVSFSGGKDSTVLLNLVREVYPDVPAVFSDTGLEYPEVRSHVKSFIVGNEKPVRCEHEGYKFEKYIKSNLEIIRPKMEFSQVIDTYGYPIISKEVSATIHYLRQGSAWAVNRIVGRDNDGKESKFKERYKKYGYLQNAPFKISHYCCKVMKIYPFEKYERLYKRKAFIGMLAEESKLRQNGYLKTGCNAFDSKRKTSNPLSVWTNQDILQYIKSKNLSIPSVYGDIIYAEQMPDGTYQQSMFGGKLITTGVDRTGCMFCMFGVHLEKGENRFQKMKYTHPKQYNYCINTLGCGKAMDYVGIRYA